MNPTTNKTAPEDKPYERGIAHLKRAAHPQAVAAFTEAIQLDPEAPNAYVGRALAYRSLGDDAAAQRDEQAAKALGGPERSAWDRLVKRGYRRWRADLDHPAWSVEDPLSRKAFLLRQWTWQIYNGGLPQWVANGYGKWADDLADVALEVGTDAANRLAAIVRDVANELESRPNARKAIFEMISGSSESGEPNIFAALSRCEEAYHRIATSFAADAKAWLERQADQP